MGDSGPSTSAFPGTLAGSWVGGGAVGARAGAHVGCQRWTSQVDLQCTVLAHPVCLFPVVL